mmetsp:Transcript_28406/g.28710  ORF Transcript_28406/g.28710 Transcript_28406/m.28710 type:complete len:236 (+) Transcript_28406:25-732(+)
MSYIDFISTDSSFNNDATRSTSYMNCSDSYGSTEGMSYCSDNGLVRDDDDYGLCDIDELYPVDYHRMDSCSSSSSSSHIQFAPKYDSAPSICKTIFSFNIKNVPMSCRSFERLNGLCKIQMSTSVTGFRIVQDASGEHAEFLVVICIESFKYMVWRRKSDFEQLLSAAEIVLQSKFLFQSTKSILKEIQKRSFWNHKNFSVKHLTWMTLKLGDFLREFLFEISMPSLLEVFVSEI